MVAVTKTRVRNAAIIFIIVAIIVGVGIWAAVYFSPKPSAPIMRGSPVITKIDDSSNVILDDSAALINNPAAINGDPVITGFHGHSMQVHGVPDESYALISTPSLEYNAQFVFLSSGHCDEDLSNRTACWSHPGTYLGEVVVLLTGHNYHGENGEDEVIVNIAAGAHSEGLTIKINNEEFIDPSNKIYSHDLFTLSHPTPFTATLTSDEFSITWQNSDQFLNQEIGMADELNSKTEKFIHRQILHTGKAKNQISAEDDSNKKLPHGLIGQSWSNKEYDNQWRWLAGDINDYQLRDGLYGKDFLHSRYKQLRVSEQKKFSKIFTRTSL